MVVIPKVGISQTDIMVEDGKIKSIGASANASATRTINANGHYVLPGAIDPHVHYGVYTPIEQAAETESRSAAVGGITTMMRMLRLYDNDYGSLKKQIQASAGHHLIDYAIHASILRQEQVSHIAWVVGAGVSSLKIYMNLGSTLNKIYMDLDPRESEVKERQVDMTDELVGSIVQAGATNGATILVHAENHKTCSELVSKGKTSGLEGLKAWSDCRPTSSEAESIASISEVARKYRASIYFVHIGSSAALDAIVTERQKGMANYYIETCPQYLTHSFEFDKLTAKVVPPIRSKTDVQSMWYALRNGIVDTVGTDHVANRLEQKLGAGDLWSALAGFPGLATMLPVLLNFGVNQDRISLERVAELTSYNTARIFGLYPRKGTIQVGSDADLTIIDLHREKTVTPELLQSYSDYTIYDGWRMEGWPVATISRGRVVMEDGNVSRDMRGEFLARPITS